MMINVLYMMLCVAALAACRVHASSDGQVAASAKTEGPSTKAVPANDYPFSSKVNLLIGTGGEGFGVGGDPPGAQVPFGALRLSPDTALDNVVFGPNHFGGYHHDDNEIRCFAHTHMVGPGALDFGNVGVMATRQIDKTTVTNYGYRSKFSHLHEQAQPGYYTVVLEDAHMTAELTACGTHTGIHRYTASINGSHALDGHAAVSGDVGHDHWNHHGEKSEIHGGGSAAAAGVDSSSVGIDAVPSPGPIVVLVDPTHSLTPNGCNGSLVSYNTSKREISGWMVSQGSLTRRNGRGVKIYFSAIVKSPDAVSAFGTWNSTGVFNGSVWSQASGTDANGAFIVSEASSVQLNIAISFISIDQARLNLERQIGDQTFDECRHHTQSLWEHNLSKVNITARDESTEVKFYTALYHSFMAPTNYAEVGGVYLGMDDVIHTLEPGREAAYSDMSIWDIHRTQASLLAWLQPSVMGDVLLSLVDMMVQGGDLPRWPIANVYASCMIGNHAYQILLDGLVKGFTDFNVSQVYGVMKLEAMTSRPHNGRDDLYNYLKYGYCIGGYKNSSVSKTLAYAYDDWAVSEFAQHVGVPEEAEYFLKRSKNYKNLWDEDHKLMCARTVNSSTFHCPLDPELNEWILESGDFTEGNAAQWRWFVPHDVPGLVQLFGGNELFASNLDTFMERSHHHPVNLLPNPYYWAGNEPDILAPHLFNFANRSDLTQKHVRWLVDNKYTTAPDGLPGNDDFGTLSAWCVWSMLGMYPLTGTQRYIVGSPSIDTATITLDDTSTVYITAHNNSQVNIYVARATVNGEPVDGRSGFLRHASLAPVSGAHTNIEFWMSNQPY